MVWYTIYTITKYSVLYGSKCDTMYGMMYEHQSGHRPAPALSFITKPTCDVNSINNVKFERLQ